MHLGTYIKSTSFNGLVFAKFASKLERNTAVALLRSVKFNEGDQTVWATQDLPPNVRARKLFLMRLRWQLGEWGFVKREIHMDEGYSNLMIEDQLILQVSDKADGVLQLAWSSEWANWEKFQQAPELHRLADFREAYKRGRQKQQQKPGPVGTRAHGHGLTATGWWHSVCKCAGVNVNVCQRETPIKFTKILSMSPFRATVPRGQLESFWRSFPHHNTER